MATEFLLGMMEEFIKEIMQMIRKKVMENIHGQMDESIKDILKMIWKKDRENLHRQMEKSMSAITKMENNMVLDIIEFQIWNQGKEDGRTVR